MSGPYAAGVSFQLDYYPLLAGSTYDPEPVGGEVSALRIYSDEARTLEVADVGPAVRVSAGRYRFPAVTIADAGVYYTIVVWDATGTGPTVTDLNDTVVVSAFGGSTGPSFPSYATTADLEAWTGEAAPNNAESLLRSATLLISAAIGRNPYGAAPTGAEADALRDATTAQVETWLAAGVTPSGGGVASEALTKRSSLGTGSKEFDTALQAAARVKAATEIGDVARAILVAAGLWPVDLPVWTSESDRLLDYGLAGSWPTNVPAAETA